MTTGFNGFSNPVNFKPPRTRQIRTSNVAPIGLVDFGSFIEYTSGTFTQTFSSAASLPDGWFVWLKNSGTGLITLDFAEGETCDALTSFIMYPSEVRIIYDDGASFKSVVVSAFTYTSTSTFTFTRPPGYAGFLGECWGAGGSGGRGLALAPAGGGGGGGYNQRFLTSAQMGASQTCTVGAGGIAQTVADTAGNAGGNTSIGSLVVGYGGGGGGATNNGGGGGGGGGTLGAGSTGINNSNGALGGEPSSNNSGSPGSGGILSTTILGVSNSMGGGGGGYGSGASAAASTGGASNWGGGGGGGGRDSTAGGVGGASFMGGAGGGGAANSTAGGAGGTSVNGGNGGAGGFDSTAATSGTAPGGGGGGNEDGNSGAGADGQIRITGIV
jgi:hypothetical protein